MTRKRSTLALGALGLVLVAVALLVLRGQHDTSGRLPSTQTLPIINPAFPTPSSEPANGYRIVSTDLKIDLPVITGDGWTVPLFKAAAYPGMALPGQNGRSFIYAHAQAGMFAPLAHASVGQHVDIVRPDGAPLHYVIREYFPRWPPSDTRYLKPINHEELILLTCTTYNANDPRILAVAEPV